MNILSRVVRKIKIIPQDIYAYLHRDEIILYDRNRPARKNHVNLHWYSTQTNGKEENLGDYLATVIYQFMIERLAVDDTKELSETKHLYTVGSILFFGFQNATVWGSGLLANPRFLPVKPKLDIRMVRGPKTREILLSKGYLCPEIYGDPALLMPLIYEGKREAKMHRAYGVILHKSDTRMVENRIEILRTDYENFIDEILRCDRIISSSLHGIILAESYGVPAVMLSDTRTDYNLIKYLDYYLSTGRNDFPIAESIEEALLMEPATLPSKELFVQMQERMMNAFPYDLWK